MIIAAHYITQTTNINITAGNGKLIIMNKYIYSSTFFYHL